MTLLNGFLIGAMTMLSAWSAVDNWRKERGFDSQKAVEVWWAQMLTDQADVSKKLPEAVAASLRKTAPGFVAVVGLAHAVSADLNCDGTIDYAVVGLPRTSRLVQALVARKKHDFQNLKSVHAEYLKYKYEKLPQIWVAHSRSQNLKWTKHTSRELPKVDACRASER